MMAALSCDLSQCVVADAVRGSFESNGRDFQPRVLGRDLPTGRLLSLFVIVKPMPLDLVAVGCGNPFQQPDGSIVEYEMCFRPPGTGPED